MKNETLKGKPDAGNPHVAPTPSYGGTGRFDEGEVASENPRRGFRLCKKMTVSLLLILFGGMAQADVYTNITAVVRANNKAVVSIENGTCPWGWYPIAKAFDGKIGNSNWDGNALIAEKPTEENPVIVYYSLADDFKTDSRFVVTAFRFYSAYITPARSIARVRLEVSENGKDGWCVLGENTFDVSLESLTEKVCTSFTVSIPASARRDARHYRFVITENLGYQGDPSKSTDASLWISELELLGEIQAPQTLVWQGGEGGTWDATAKNWQSDDEASVAWQARRTASIGSKAVTLSGEAEVAELALTDLLTAQTISGGTLAMRIPGRITARNGDTISSAFAAGLSRERVFECGDGLGFPPRDTADTKIGSEAVYYSNCRISEITGVVGKDGDYWYYANSKGAWYTNYPTYFKLDDSGVCTFQMHSLVGRTDNFLTGEKFTFWQDGDNVLGCVNWVKKAWSTAEPYDLEKQTMDDWARCILPVWGETGENHAGVRNLAVTTEESSALTVDCGGKVVLDIGTWLPPASDSDKTTGMAVTYIENDVLATVGDIVSATGVCYGKTVNAIPHHVVRTADRVTVQFQYFADSFANCVKVEFVQNGNNVDARVVYVKAGGVPVGTDFDDSTLGSKVWTGTIGWSAQGGLDVKNIIVRRAGTIHLDGAFPSDRSVAIHRGVVELGASTLSLSQRFSGDGTLAFSPATDSQTVAFDGFCDCAGGLALSGATKVTVIRSAAFATEFPVSLMGGGATLSVAADTTNAVETVSIAGVNTLEVGRGAQVTMDAVTFADDAVVNLVVDKDTALQSVRIGTSQCLSKAELAHFRVNGQPVCRQTADGWLDPRQFGMMVIIR